MNQLSLFPFVFDLRLGSEPLIAGVPFLTKPDTGMSLFHASTADWSQTLTLALMTVIGTQIIAFSIHPIRHIGNYIKIQRFFRIKSPMDILFGLVDILLGVLEFAGDLAKVVSLSARLFGNLFAGEVMVMVFVKVVFPFFAATPIILLGILSAIVQAYVFTFLSLQFMAGTVEAARGEA
jgi:F-type H+-transporting ATPase subunit a